MHPTIAWPAERQVRPGPLADGPKNASVDALEAVLEERHGGCIGADENGDVQVDALTLHPCAAFPDLYPDEVDPLGAGSIHAHAGIFLRDFIASRLADQNTGQPFVVEFDVPLYRAPRSHVTPDVYAYVNLRRTRGPAPTYHIEHDGVPALVIEIISVSTWKKDLGLGRNTDLKDKKDFYRRIGVSEYWIYDPEGHRRDKTCLFEGFRLGNDGTYAPILQDGAGRWFSAVLQAQWEIGSSYDVPGGRPFILMRLINPDTNAWYLTAAERDEQLAVQNAQLAAQNAQLAAQDEQLAAQDTQLAAQDEQLAAQDTQLAAQDEQLAEKDTQLAERDALLALYRRRFGAIDPE